MGLTFSQTLDQVFRTVSRVPLPPGLSTLAKGGATGERRTYYDLYLVETRQGPFALCFMKLNFTFVQKSRNAQIDREIEEAAARSNLPWTQAEAADFIRIWQAQVQSVWNTRSLTTSPRKAPVGLQFHFQTQTPSGCHWNIEVAKLVKGKFIAGATDYDAHSVYINNNELIPDEHPRQGQKQRGSVHEFAHMLNLRDDYFKPEEAARSARYRQGGTEHARDYPSVTNRGETVLPRHLERIKAWVDAELKRWASYETKAAS